MNNKKNVDNQKSNIRKILFWLFGLMFLILLITSFFLVSKINKLEEKIESSKSEKEVNENQEINKDNEKINDNIRNISENEMLIKIPELSFSKQGNSIIEFKKFKVKKTKNILNSTLKKLFNIRGDKNGVWNGLKFEKVIIKNKIAIIILSGKWISEGDMSRLFFKKEIEESAFQYDTVDNIRVLIGNSIFDWCIDSDFDGLTSCSEKKELWDTSLQNNNNNNNSNGSNKIPHAISQNLWKPCDGLFYYNGNQGNSTFIDTEMDHVTSPLIMHSGYEIRGCLRQIAGSYDNWGPFEGTVGYYKIKDQNKNTLVSGSLNVILTNTNYPDWITAAIAGQDLAFREIVNYNFNSVLGQKGVLEIHNENASGNPARNRVKKYSIIFGT